jgi:hypothetical protein
MTRKKRDRLALILGLVTFFAILTPGFVLVMVAQERDNDRQHVAWGQEMNCAISGQDSRLVTYRSSLQREVTVTCADQQPHTVMMAQKNSVRSSTSVWYNSLTGEKFIRYDEANGGYGLRPTIWSTWLFALIPILVVAAGAGLFIRSRIRYPRTQEVTPVNPVTASS